MRRRGRERCVFCTCHYIMSSLILAVDWCHAGSDPTVTYWTGLLDLLFPTSLFLCSMSQFHYMGSQFFSFSTFFFFFCIFFHLLNITVAIFLVYSPNLISFFERQLSFHFCVFFKYVVVNSHQVWLYNPSKD